MKKISQNGIELIKSFEGCQLNAYKAVETEIFWTIGWGHYGPDVYNGMSITQSQADTLLVMDLIRYENFVNDSYYCSLTSELNQNQFDALVSFCYNCGQGSLRSLCYDSTLNKIGEDMLLYNRSGGKVLAGLTKRRKAEYDLYNRKVGLELDDKYVDYILDVLSNYWNLMEGNKENQDYTHFVANQLRKAVGRPEED